MNPRLTRFTHDYHWLSFDDQLNPNHLDSQSPLLYQDAFIRWLPLLNEQASDTRSYGLIHWYPIDQPTILLGAKDKRLPDLQAGLDFLHQAGYQTFIRPHGGLAVVCDPGVMNVSMVWDQNQTKLSIDEAYQVMVDWVGTALAKHQLKVEAYEIPDSYCPGKYDLVVGGQKIGGIAQRRFRDGVTTAAYLSVRGDQDQRSQLIHDFYQVAQAGPDYPSVRPQVMTSIDQLLALDYSLNQFQADMLAVFPSEQIHHSMSFLNPELSEIYQQVQAQHQKRQGL
ncbi:lipoate--protein ligase family protein [Hutsoniella sourekii]